MLRPSSGVGGHGCSREGQQAASFLCEFLPPVYQPASAATTRRPDQRQSQGTHPCQVHKDGGGVCAGGTMPPCVSLDSCSRASAAPSWPAAH